METAETFGCVVTRVRARRAQRGEVVDVPGVGNVLPSPAEWVVEVPGAGRLVPSESMFEALFRPVSSD
jgi:hypothetical protein